MSKKANYREHLTELINESLKTGMAENLMNYLKLNSNLPGPRGNIELAARAFRWCCWGLHRKRL
jgi:2-keto-4-pentenoate hydratase/2-oxohepta-3-ene-1,7-dioic acid hydratase in catechol pathway